MRVSDHNDAVWFVGALRAACIPLQSIVNATGLYDINLFSLDVEGAELAVLNTVNWDVTNVQVLLVELDGDNKIKDQKVRDLLLSLGFESAEPTLGSVRSACVPGRDCTVNEVYINPQFHARKRPRKLYSFGTSVPCCGSPPDFDCEQEP